MGRDGSGLEVQGTGDSLSRLNLPMRNLQGTPQVLQASIVRTVEVLCCWCATVVENDWYERPYQFDLSLVACRDDNYLSVTRLVVLRIFRNLAKRPIFAFENCDLSLIERCYGTRFRIQYAKSWHDFAGCLLSRDMTYHTTTCYSGAASEGIYKGFSYCHGHKSIDWNYCKISTDLKMQAPHGSTTSLRDWKNPWVLNKAWWPIRVCSFGTKWYSSFMNGKHRRGDEVSWSACSSWRSAGSKPMLELVVEHWGYRTGQTLASRWGLDELREGWHDQRLLSNGTIWQLEQPHVLEHDISCLYWF